MKLKGFIYKYFGYSRSERTGAFVLMLMVFIIISASLLRSARDSGMNIAYTSSADTSLIDSTAIINNISPEYFLFDPNTVSFDSLLLLGLSRKNASTLINYRNSGARFRLPSDLKKVFGIPRELSDTLMQYIKISELSEPEAVSHQKDVTRQSHKASVNDSAGKKPYREAEHHIWIDLNSADSADLEQLPGIGRVLGARIVKYRKLLGGYISVTQLAEVYGIDSLLLSQLIGLAYTDTTLVSRINLNYATYSDVLRHPYIDQELCRDIFYYRRLSGRINSLDELVTNRISDQETISRIGPYITLKDTSSY